MVKKFSSELSERPDDSGTALVDMGAEVRGLRQAHGLTLADLAARSGLSVGFLSKIERGRARPSLTALQDIAEALDVHVGWFFATDGPVDADERGLVVRRDARRRLGYVGGRSTDYLGLTDHLLSATLDRALALGISTYTPGGSSGDDLYTHEGEEAGLVLDGTIVLHLDDRTFRLVAGDSFSFESTRPHRFENPGPGDARIVWANTPVSLRRHQNEPEPKPGPKPEPKA